MCLRERKYSLIRLAQLLSSHRSLFLKSWLHYVEFLIPKKISVILVKLSGKGVRGKKRNENDGALREVYGFKRRCVGNTGLLLGGLNKVP